MKPIILNLILTFCLIWMTGTAEAARLWKIEVEPSNAGTLRYVKVALDEGQLLISGGVKRHTSHAGGIGDHVDISILDREGKVIAWKTSSIRFGSGSTAGNTKYYKTFVVRFPAEMADQSRVIRVKYRGNIHAFCRNK